MIKEIEVQKWFIKVMEAYENKFIDKSELIDCFLEIADQQYRQYKPINETLCLQIDSGYLRFFNLDNLSEAEIFVPLAHSLAISTDCVKKLESKIRFEDLKNELNEMLMYTTKGRINPYWNLK